MPVQRVLLLEDSPPDAELVVELLAEQHAAVAVTTCGTLRDALELLSGGTYDVALVDLTLPDASGLDGVRALRTAAPELPLVVLTGVDSESVALDALAAGAQDYVSKQDLSGRLLVRCLRYAAERARAELALRRSARWTSAVLDGLEAPTCAVDEGGRVVALNAAMRDEDSVLPLVCRPGDELLGAEPASHRNAPEVVDALSGVLLGALERAELECRTPDDSWWSVRITPLPAGVGAVVMQVDVTALKRAQQQLSTAALHDPLTGLPNRTLLHDRLVQAFAYAEEEQRHVAVVFLDLDRFKLVNDTLGHHAGDAVLVAVADRLLTAVPRSETVARVSGDEYVVVFLADSEAHAHAVATGLLEAVNGPLLVDGREVVVSAAAGLAVAVAGESADDVLRAADEAMYAAKARGRGRLEVASHELRALLERRLLVEAALDDALAEDRLEVHYQPVVRLSDGTATGVEALVRLRQRDGRLVPPGEFIEVAERSGQIVALGTAVLDRACHEAASWRGAAAALTVAVNLSTRQLGQPDVVEQVQSSLRSSGLDPARLVLEVTESSVVEDAEAALTALTALKQLGVRTAIDDFGTGYSSFLYLKQFPVDILKIDRSFVSGMLDSPDDAAIVASIVRLGLDVGLTLVAEGVETEEQRAHLLALGCTEAQGYLFCRPVAAPQLAAGLLAAQRSPTPPAAPVTALRRRSPAVDPAVLQRMSQLSAKGASLHTIAAVLNGDGLLSPAGRRWHPSAVARCLGDAQAAGRR